MAGHYAGDISNNWPEDLDIIRPREGFINREQIGRGADLVHIPVRLLNF